jgi:hypothetical protein
VQVLLSPTSWVAAEADAAAAMVATEIDHQAELELLVATAAATLGGRWSILLQEMMKHITDLLLTSLFLIWFF